MDYYAPNLKLLEKREPDLCKRLQETTPGKTLFQDSSDISRLVSPNLDLTTIDIFVVLGFGSGGQLIALERYLPPRIFLLIIEHDSSLFKRALQERNFGSLLTSRRVSLAIGEDPFAATRVRLDNYYHIVTFACMHIIEHEPSVKLVPSYYQKIKDRLREAADVSRRNIATLTNSAPLWQHNILTNLPIIADSPGANTLFGRFKNIPAIIAAAGPSLDKNVSDLKQAKGKALIIAVDTALRSLCFNGIEPDIVVSIDANPANFKDYEGVSLNEAVLLAEPVTYPEILSEFSREIFVSSYGHPLMRWIEESIGEKGYLKVGGSVATTCFDLARKMECNPIIFVGQDLAYTGGMSHTRGFFGGEEMLEGVSKFATLEMRHREVIRERGVEFVEGVDGEMVQTSPMMKGWLNWLESQVNEIKSLGIECIDATEGGARIGGTKILALKEAISSYCQKIYNIYDRLALTYSSYHPCPLIRLINELEKLIRDYRRIKEEVNEGEKLARRLLWLLREEGTSKKATRTHERIQRLYNSVTQRAIFMRVSRWSMEPLFFEMKKGKQNNKPETIARLYHTFFEGALKLVSEGYNEFNSCKKILEEKDNAAGKLEAIGG